jgi:hypothetical protein
MKKTKNTKPAKPMAVLLITLIASLGLSLAGCTTHAPTQGYRPANYAGVPWQIGGYNDSLSLNGVIHITINGTEVIKKGVPVLGNITEATGSYEGKAVTATITKVQQAFSSYIRADVFVNGEKAASLSF